ncbi:MAG: ABC transporter ATP-binding protein [Syntrophobacterales bacterium]|nr:MAG: ABC transporter ATP-binding protein [Syntrophobacterales bacterium]
MHVDYGYFEGDHLGKPYDIKLLRRLFTYARPYRLIIGLSIVLMLFVTGFELLFPYLIKVAIDNYIVVSARQITLSTRDSHLQKMLLDRYGAHLLPTVEPGTFLLLPSDLKEFDRRDLVSFQRAGIISEDRFYPFSPSEGVEKVVKQNPSYFQESGGYYFISYRDMKHLERKDLLTLRRGDIRGVAVVSAIFILILILSFGFNFVQVYAMEYTGQKVMHDLRMRVFGHIQRLSLSFFDRTPIGRLVTRVTNDVQNLHEMLTTVFSHLVKDIFLLAGIIVVLIKINWELALVCFSLLPLIIYVTFSFSGKARDAFREVRLKIAKINATLQENFSGIKVVQIFNRERENHRRFKALNHENYLANMRQIGIFALFVPIIEIVGTIAIALLIWYGGGKVISNTLSLGTLVAFLSYLRMFFQPIRDIAEKYNLMQSAMASTERIFGVLDNREMIPEPSVPKSIVGMRGNIDFRNVTFSYTGDDSVLRDISFSVRGGETAAIVGATGAGKTSIISLLERFYDPQSGQILIDGVDVRELETSFLRSQIGLVLQDVFLFAGDIQSNIQLGNDGLSRDDIERIIRYVNVDRLIQKLPRGLQEDVKEGGSSLSVGERQLLAFARALAVNPKILILDEATSSVDTETEGLIQDALGKLMQGRTSIIIAHRLSTIQRADRIILMHKGRIREMGTQAQLMAKKGFYHKLYQLQYKP